MVINMVFGQEEYELGLLGRQGENIETVLRIDCTSVLEECPGATIGVRWKDNVPGEEYYDLAVTKAEDGIYEAKLTTMDLRYAGNKDIVVRVIEGEWEKRSCTFMGYVAKSLFDFRPPAGPVSDYLSRLMKALAKAEDIQKHGPVIGENGHWYIFDGGAYVDTGVKAEGRDGEDGYSPTLTAERVGNGVKLTVTNKESSKEVWVYDGEKGDNATDEQIRAAVDAYMQDNPIEAPTVELDPTLSVSGKAADAGAVGDALTVSADMNADGVVEFKNAAGIVLYTLDLSGISLDTYGDIVISLDALALTEGGSGTFAVNLSAAPSNDQVVYIAVNDETRLSVTPAAIIFTAANYNTPQEVTVIAAQDEDYDDNEGIITLTSQKYSKQIVVIITDDDELYVPFGGKEIVSLIRTSSFASAMHFPAPADAAKKCARCRATRSTCRRSSAGWTRRFRTRSRTMPPVPRQRRRPCRTTWCRDT